MDEFTIVTVIGRPVEEVFAVSEDVAKMPLWNPGMSEARITSDGPLQPGATLVFRGTFLGRAYETNAVCTACTENKQIATKSTAGPFYLETDTVLEPVDAGTRVTSTYRGESRGFFKLAEPLVIRLAKKHFEAAGENLRTLLEDHAL
jgi:ribosome-associated toxin RatA of RatAB toxin-antitoxin module